MLLPNADEAIIEAAKLHGYLLSTAHPLGRFKARFFNALGFSADRWQELESALGTQHLTQEAALGFSADRWQKLESALRTQHLTLEAGPAPVMRSGQKFTIRAILTGPNGQSATVVSVWFIRSGESAPRFVTAYPGEQA